MLNNHLSDLNFAKEKITKDLEANKNRSLSALFRDIRKYDSVDGIGDFPIMSLMVQEVSKYRKLNQQQVWRLCKLSKEYQLMGYGDKQRFTKALWQSILY